MRLVRDDMPCCCEHRLLAVVKILVRTGRAPAGRPRGAGGGGHLQDLFDLVRRSRGGQLGERVRRPEQVVVAAPSAPAQPTAALPRPIILLDRLHNVPHICQRLTARFTSSARGGAAARATRAIANTVIQKL